MATSESSTSDPVFVYLHVPFTYEELADVLAAAKERHVVATTLVRDATMIDLFR